MKRHRRPTSAPAYFKREVSADGITTVQAKGCARSHTYHKFRTCNPKGARLYLGIDTESEHQTSSIPLDGPDDTLNASESSSPGDGSDSEEDSDESASQSNESATTPDDRKESTSCASSIASTIRYDHEPFSTFAIRVKHLVDQVMPAKTSFLYKIGKTYLAQMLRSKSGAAYRLFPDEPAIEIKRLRGGGFNRVLGISLHNYAGAAWDLRSRNEDQMILQIPRHDESRPDRDIATLAFVKQHLPDIPIPEPVQKDFTKSNPIGKPYVIYKRIPGIDLQEI